MVVWPASLAGAGGVDDAIGMVMPGIWTGSSARAGGAACAEGIEPVGNCDAS